jgi:putative flavoprotein involved in K+ transport
MQGSSRCRTSFGALDTHPHYDWIDLSLRTHNGLPIHDRGIVESCPGLYFVGLLFLYSLSSALLGGVGRDAKHIVEHIVSTRAA